MADGSAGFAGSIVIPALGQGTPLKNRKESGEAKIQGGKERRHVKSHIERNKPQVYHLAVDLA